MEKRFPELFLKQYLIKRLAAKSKFFKQWHIQIKLNQMKIADLENRLLEEYGYFE